MAPPILPAPILWCYHALLLDIISLLIADFKKRSKSIMFANLSISSLGIFRNNWEYFYRYVTPLILTTNTNISSSLNSQQSVFAPLTSSIVVGVRYEHSQSYTYFKFSFCFSQFDLFTLVIYFYDINPN